MRNVRWGWIAVLVTGVLLICVPLGADANSLLEVPGQPQYAAIGDGTLYVATNEGLFSCAHPEGTVSSDTTVTPVDTGDDISAFAIPVYQQSLLLVDLEEKAIWTQEQGAFQKKADVSGLPDSSHADEYAWPVCEDGYLFLIRSVGGMPTQSELIRIDLNNGTAQTMDSRGFSQLASYQPGKLLAIRNGLDGDTPIREIVTVDTATAAVGQPTCRLSGLNDGGLAWSAEDGYVYAVLNGQLSRWNGQNWETLRPYTCAQNAVFYGVKYGIYLEGSHTGIRMTETKKSNAETVLTIVGQTPAQDVDEGFQNAHPDIVLSRSVQPAYNAQDVFQAIQTGDKTTDLFLIPLDSAAVKLIQKGYLAPLSGSAALVQDHLRLYPNLAEPLALNGTLYAVPSGMDVLCWAMKMEDAQRFTVPRTMEELMSGQADWEENPLNDGVAWVTRAYDAEPWQPIDYMYNLLEQYLLSRSDTGEPVDFSDPAFRTLLERAASLEPPASGIAGDGDEPVPGVLAADDFLSLSGSGQTDQLVTVLPPAFNGQTEACVPARMTVYVMNPNSPNPSAAIAYLEYLAANRPVYEEAKLCADVSQGTMNTSVLESITERQRECDATEELLQAAAPEDRKGLETDLAAMKAEIEGLQNSPGSWLVYPPLLTEYRSAVEPRLTLGLDPSLNDAGSNGASGYADMQTALRQYADGLLTLDGCIAKLNNIRSIAELENAE